MCRTDKSDSPPLGLYLATAALLAATLTVSRPASAGPPCTADDPRPDEVTVIGQSVSSLNQWPRSSAWGISYRKTFLSCFAASMAYLNDGHFPGHHRDGVAIEGWVPLDFHILSRPVALSVGAGPFYYYDTVFAQNTGGYADAHAWTWLASADLIVQPFLSGPWSHLILEARIDHTSPAKSIETTSIGAAIGYRGISDFDLGQRSDGGSLPPDEVVASYWKTVTNSFNSGSHQAPAESVMYLRRFGGEFGLSAAVLNEGDTELIRRNGVIAEGWAEPTFGSGLFSIGAGFGFYSAIDKYRPSPGRHVSDVVSATVSVCLPKNFAMRFLWHRIVTDYNRDTDVVLWGLAYRF
jgi:hypothetical protein